MYISDEFLIGIICGLVIVALLALIQVLWINKQKIILNSSNSIYYSIKNKT